MPSTRRSPLPIALLGALALLGSCATAPRVQRSAAAYLDMLPAGQSAYASLDVSNTREIVPALAARLGMQTRELEGALSRARALYAAVLLRPGQGPAYAAIVAGDFPPGGVRASLCLRGQKRKTAGGEVWYEDPKRGVQIAAVERGLIVVSNGGVLEAVAAIRHPAYASIPADVVAQAADDDLLVYFPAVPGGAGSLGGGKAPPVDELWLLARLSGEPTEEGAPLTTPLEVSLGFRLSGEREARLFRPVLRLLLLALSRQGRIPGGAEALSAIHDEVEGNVVRLEGLRFSVEEALGAAQALLGGAGGTGGTGGASGG